MKNKKLFLLISFVLLASWVPKGFSLSEPTHEYLNQEISRKPIVGFSLDSYLKNNLGFQKGSEEPLFGYSEVKRTDMARLVWEWVGEGGFQEDRPGSATDYLPFVGRPTRSVNHFHNPLGGLWEYSGLDDSIGPLHYTGQSSIIWAQNPNQDPGGKWSWHDARRYFYNALTGIDSNGNVVAQTQKDREKYFANTFRALGQLIHLVQDASVPAHTRNEIHALYFHYEGWLEKIRTGNVDQQRLFAQFMANPCFDSSILNLVPLDPSAPIPIANIVDTDKYGGSNPDITATSTIGISEYTNANFFGERSIFSGRFPYPAPTSVDKEYRDIPDPRGVNPTVRRQYYIKKRDGEKGKNPNEGYRLATVGLLEDYIIQHFPWERLRYAKPALDGGVYNDYASLLLPRAVGYSAGLLNYFFRGQLQVTSLPIFYQNRIYIMRVKIKNITPTEETMKDGWYTLSYRYTKTDNPAEGPKDVFGQVTVCSPNEPCEELKYNEETSIDFYLPELILGENYASVKFTLAFKGALENKDGAPREDGAVIGKYFTPGEIKFSEEWNNGLTVNHPWAHVDWRTSEEYPNHGSTTNAVTGDILIKDNIRYTGYKNPSANSSFVGSDPIYSGHEDILPILITPQTSLQYKINQMWIDPIPPAPQGYTSHYQCLWLHFNNDLHIQITQENQGVYYGPTTAIYTFPVGYIVVSNIYKMFEDAGITIPDEPLYLHKISFSQQLFELGEPSAEQHRQHMEVDFIRLIEEKQDPSPDPGG
jgi:hypothetical protein